MIPYGTDREVAAALPAVVTHLARRGLIAYPTETVYGFGSVTAAPAVDRLCALKGREPGKPFLVLVANRQMLAGIGLRLTDAAERFASAFWPGPLTLVLPGGEGTLPDTLRGPEGGIAVRWTSHPGAAHLIQTLGSPITSTSANRPGQPSLVAAPEIERIFGRFVSDGTLLVLDAGRLPTSPPSTLIDCTGSAPRVLREGAISRQSLASIVPSLDG
ncbi:MAG: threonylcarbamoyl-AMP synthase [Gemmatimonadetes bacterium 21-71-4]|nr:MAG: threonylcarbamoyl-AMP synthase [Gemmatimonadetes bacterium 21-71-4]